MRALALLSALVPAAALAFAACGNQSIGGAGPDAAAEAAAGEAGADAAPVPKGARVLGLGLDLAAGDFYPNVKLARDAGVSSTNVDLPWDGVEVAFDAGADADAAIGLYAPALHAVNLILPDAKMSVVLGVPAIDETGPRLPPDLVGKAIDDEAVMSRYEALEDYVVGELVDTDVSAFLVGAGVDGPLGDDPARWSAFARFVTRAASHMRASHPKLKVGFTMAADSLSARKDLVAAALAASDVVAVDYVAAGADGRALPVDAVGSDIARAVAAAPTGKPMFFRAVGYPSAPEAGGSDDAQAAFVSAVFTAWDGAADRVGTLGFYALDDVTDQQAAARAAALGRPDPAFAAMIGSLGFRTAGGRIKPSLRTLVREAGTRGF